MKKLFICERPYMLYKTIVKALLNEEDEMDVVLSNHMQGMEKMKEPLENSHLFHRVFFFDDKLYQDYIKNEHLSDYVKFPKILIAWPKKMGRYYKFHKMARREKLPQGLDFNAYDEIYAIDGVSTINLRMNFKKVSYIVSEHAKNNFQINMLLHKLAVRISLIFDRLNIIVAYSGCSKYVSAIEVSENKNLVSYLKEKKIIVYNVAEMVQKLDDKKKNKILELYALAYDKKLLDIHGDVNILLTAPLLEDGLVDTSEKAEQCWKSLVNTYADKECRLLIKAHPRDKTDYGKIFPDSIVVNNLVSVEVLAFATNLGIGKVLNLYSSTVDVFKHKCECITVGREYLDRMQDNTTSSVRKGGGN